MNDLRNELEEVVGILPFGAEYSRCLLMNLQIELNVSLMGLKT